ncbi:hypothetical protein [Plasmodium yoelii yoelii]|uniref:Uncharacterized protein n=1 Tax=Plasmodium yoelii yoelii TaxID=73239 RepID=Q7RCE8_PLAYO|nr:hypothetical protein [Plasmodium yoelii yoelii]
MEKNMWRFPIELKYIHLFDRIYEIIKITYICALYLHDLVLFLLKK